MSDYCFDAEAIAESIAEWVAIESPSYDAAAVNQMMDLAAATLARMGAAVERFPGSDGFGDLVKAHFAWGEGPGLMVLGHLDTVHLVGTTASSLPLRRDGDRLYGPGTQDMKGGVVLSILALEAVLAARGPLSLPVTFLFIPDEEVGSPSTRALIEAEAKRCKAVLVPEPGRDDRFVTGRHAFLRYKLHVTGRPAHAGVAKGVGRSAISVMARLIETVEGFSDVERETTFRVGRIEGGTFVNVVPTECHAEVLCVAPSAEAFQEVQRRMASLRSPDPEVALTVEPGPVRPLFQAHEATLELYEVARRVARDLDMEMGHGQFGGGSDGNFTGALGVATLDGLGVIGRGLHTKEEHLYVSKLPARAELLARLYEALSDRNR